MIVELTGIPGSGKSTIIKNLQEKRCSANIVYDIQDYILQNRMYSLNFLLRGKFIYELVLLFLIFKLKKEDVSLLKLSFFLIKKSGNSFFHKINIMRNITKKILIYRYLEVKKDKIFVVDEGISHIPLNIFVDIRNEIDARNLEKLINFLPKVDKILVIEAHDDVLLNRVIKRGASGHRRMNFSSDDDIIRFMKCSRIVLEKMKKRYNINIFWNEADTINVKQIFNMIGIK